MGISSVSGSVRVTASDGGAVMLRGSIISYENQFDVQDAFG